MMAELRRGYAARSAAHDDLEAVAAVLVADDLADIGEPHFDAGFLREQWARLRFDLGSDAWVVAASGGAIVGYAESVHEEPGIVESWGVVHPEHRGQGIGSYLLDRIEDRAATHVAGIPGARVRHATTSSLRKGRRGLEAQAQRGPNEAPRGPRGQAPSDVLLSAKATAGASGWPEG